MGSWTTEKRLPDDCVPGLSTVIPRRATVASWLRSNKIERRSISFRG